MAQPNLFSMAAQEAAKKPIPAAIASVVTAMHVTKEDEIKDAQIIRKIIPQDMKIAQDTNNVKAAFDLAIPLGSMIDGAVRDYVENKSGIADYLEKMIAQEVARKQPNLITINSKPPVKIDGKLHAAFEECLEDLSITQQIFISGPAGTGKTSLAKQLAQALNIPFGFISCTAGTSEAQLQGTMIADGKYLESQFVKCYENGGLFLFDEVDAADANTMLVVNSALANGDLSLPKRTANPIAKRHKDFYCVCAANTWGNGSNEYVGRNPLDGAFLDRFTLTMIPVTYDMALEKIILKDYPVLANVLWKIRANLADAKLRRIVSTRAFAYGQQFMASGKTATRIIEKMMRTWDEPTKLKAMKDVHLNPSGNTTIR